MCGLVTLYKANSVGSSPPQARKFLRFSDLIQGKSLGFSPPQAIFLDLGTLFSEIVDFFAEIVDNFNKNCRHLLICRKGSW